jgi:hypothetical protein
MQYKNSTKNRFLSNEDLKFKDKKSSPPNKKAILTDCLYFVFQFLRSGFKKRKDLLAFL